MTPLEKISQFLHRRFGWGFSHPVMTSLGHAVAGRMEALGLGVMDDYWQLLENNNGEVSQLVEASVVRETFFFRYPESFTALSKWALDRPGKPLRILSMACSTGEEPYTIAMHLLDSGIGSFDIEARDLSPEAIVRARRGIYTANAFRSADLSWRGRYFRESGEKWEIREELRGHVHFQQGNLLEIDETAAWDVIFCRNVLIYFSTPKQEDALARLRNALADDGLLFLGPAEPPVLFQFGWAPYREPMSFCCTKTNLPAPAGPPPLRGILPPKTSRALPMKPIKPLPISMPLPPVEEPVRSELEKAQSLADSGKLDDALAVLETALKSDGSNAELHFLQGVIEEARGGNRKAETHYRRTLFLDPAHAGALQHMTLLLRSEGRNRAADNLSRRASRHSS